MLKPIYVPILKAKQGERDAVIHLSERATNQIIPWFDVSQLDEKFRIKCDEKREPAIESFLDKTASEIADAWSIPPIFLESRAVFIDLPRWASNAQTENGEHIVSYLRNRLEYLGVSVNPVVRYDIWEDPVYMNAVKSIRLEKGRSFCIRLSMDADTVADIVADPDYVSEHLLDIINQLAIAPVNTYLLIDFGDISGQKYYIEELIDTAKKAISLAINMGFVQIMLAGSSLPSSISAAVKEQNSSGLVLRKEMMVWQALRSENPSINIIFADYGVRNPNLSDEPKSCPNANGKIRYTIDKQYLIVRGVFLYKGLIGFQQYIGLAQSVVDSGYYLGPRFSWGDEILFKHSKSESKGPGSQKSWISYETNHHIETVLMEVLEFNRQLMESLRRQTES